MKALAVASLAFILLEPLLTSSRPRRGANAFAVLADNSQSLLIHDDNDPQSRGDWVRDRLRQGSPWQARLGQDFDVRNYVFDSYLRSVEDFDALAFDGTGTSLGTSLSALSKRFRGLPLAGVLLFTDGNRTDLGDVGLVVAAAGLSRRARHAGRHSRRRRAGRLHQPDELRVGPGRPSGRRRGGRLPGRADRRRRDRRGRQGRGAPAGEIGRGREAARASGSSSGPSERGSASTRSAPSRPRRMPGPKGETVASGSSEQTLANNSRLVVVDQGGGPYRVLYVGGRPNWEFKFLRRALYDDEQVQLVGLLRIARRQPKFDFQSSARNRTISPLFDGFDHPDADTAERADQSVLVRLGTLDEVELRDGFPKTAEELYRYHAIVIDDLEAAFFTQDQLGLLRNFVSTRGGGLLMLGGPDSFADGKYDRTPVGELLPVYLNGSPWPPASARTDWCSPARAGSSPGCGRGRPRRRNGSGWPRCPTSRPSAAWAASSRGPSPWPRSATTRGTTSPRWSARRSARGTSPPS